MACSIGTNGILHLGRSHRGCRLGSKYRKVVVHPNYSARDPFAAHNTDETCSEKSKGRIRALLEASEKAIKPEANFQSEQFYVMFAPNCATGKFAPPNHKGPHFFSPPSIVDRAKRKGHDGLMQRKKQKRAPKCCPCTKGNCTDCKCAKGDVECDKSCASASCQYKKKPAKTKDA